MKVNKVFRIPVKERFTSVGKTATTFGRCKYTAVDGRGLLVYFDNESDVNPEFIRKHLIGRRDNFVNIVAKSPGEAIGVFLYSFEGAQIGGDSEDEKAMWINREKAILELPYCSLMHKNSDEKLTCGVPDIKKDNNGEFGMCVLEGYDAPDNCPLSEFFREVSKANADDLGGKEGNLLNTPFYQVTVFVPKNIKVQEKAEVS